MATQQHGFEIKAPWTAERVRKRIDELGEWFHNMNLGGVQTAPEHFLGDYPWVKWRQFSSAIPADLRDKTVLDIGCNAGFYALEMKKRGARRVLGIDSSDHYLQQARFAAEVTGLDIELAKLSVYDVAQLREKFDLVLFLGVLYHLRYPMLALDLLRRHAVHDMLVVQSMLRGSPDVAPIKPDYPFTETKIFELPTFPRLYFVERKYSHDPTNWWIPNRACLEAMLRCAGFDIVGHPEPEVFVTRASQKMSPAPEELVEVAGPTAEKKTR
jgi:tRNA (mo5U34)-methyltransferase